MENARVIAKSLAVEVPASVPVGGSAASARSVEVPASVPMGGGAERARSLAVEVPTSVLMENARNGARSLAVEVRACGFGRLRIDFLRLFQKARALV